MEKWKPTPEEYSDLIISLVGLMQKESAWKRMLSRLYACANQLFVSNGYDCPNFHNPDALKAFMKECREKSKAYMEDLTV